ncbi:MAG: helix-turn-helix transcriptional regulator [Erythrobacter sp.]
MATGPDTLTDTLTDKEKDALRLLLRGHDAKSCARELALSVHTVNERLRKARRKLGTTSSREAARVLMAAEGEETPETLGDKPLGDAVVGDAPANDGTAANGWWAKRRFAVMVTGALMMSLLLAALLIPQSPLALLPSGFAATSAATGEAQAEQSAIVAENEIVLAP